MDATLLHPPTRDQLRRQGNLQLQTPCENEPLANGAALVAAPIKNSVQNLEKCWCVIRFSEARRQRVETAATNWQLHSLTIIDLDECN